jgi:hypothetical protein
MKQLKPYLVTALVVVAVLVLVFRVAPLSIRSKIVGV